MSQQDTKTHPGAAWSAFVRTNGSAQFEAAFSEARRFRPRRWRGRWSVQSESAPSSRRQVAECTKSFLSKAKRQ